MFTSRLPKPSASVRRPGNRNDGSTSFFNSNIPKSVRKTNLFTPQPERSLHSSLATSTTRKSYIATDKKRAKPDSDEQMSMYRSLVDYIKSIEPNFPMPEAKRFFSTISGTEASRIFEVLINQIKPDFKINKLEIDIPELLAKLNYPYIKTVTRSSLVSITTRQAIVNLLVIYNWLVNAISEGSTGDNNEDLDDPYADDGDKLVLQSLMIDPEGDYGEEYLYEAFEKMHPIDSYDAYLKELKEINEECEQMNEHLMRNDENFKEFKKYETDLEACNEYNLKMSEYVENLQDEYTNIKQEEQKIVANLQEKRTVLEDLNFKTINVDHDQNLDEFAQIENELRSTKHLADGYRNQDTQHMKHLLEDEEQQLARLRDRLKKMRNSHSEESNQLKNNLKAEEEKDADIARLNFEYLRSLLEKNKQRAEAIVHREEEETERWTKISQILRDNKETAKKAMKMLRG